MQQHRYIYSKVHAFKLVQLEHILTQISVARNATSHVLIALKVQLFATHVFNHSDSRM